MRCGDLVVTTAIYRSQCGCDLLLELSRGVECPPCPKCDRPVEWAYQRSTYRPATGGRPVAPERPPIRVTAP